MLEQLSAVGFYMIFISCMFINKRRLFLCSEPLCLEWWKVHLLLLTNKELK